MLEGQICFNIDEFVRSALCYDLFLFLIPLDILNPKFKY